MRSRQNRRVLLSGRPSGIPTADYFTLDTAEIPELGEGQVLVRNLYLSVEPAMRGWVSSESNYAEPVPIGAVMRSYATGRVEQSRHQHFTVGDVVTGMFGWQEYAVVDDIQIHRVLDQTRLPVSTSLGVLGLNGVTAYFGLLDVGQPRQGETVVVSSAAGAVGSCVGQIAKIHGCRTVGIAGGDVKVKMCLDEFGFDAAIDYRSDDLDAAIADACPMGVDVYFDNTSGVVSDTVLPHLNVGARVVICGTASITSWDPLPVGPRIERHLLTKRACMQGFLAIDYSDRFADAWRNIAQWIRQGRLHYREDILEGLEHAPDAIAGLYRGENLGKRLIHLP